MTKQTAMNTTRRNFPIVSYISFINLVPPDSFPDAEETYLQVAEEHKFPLPSGMRDVHPSGSLLAGELPPRSGYRFRYPRMIISRTSINDFSQTSLHVGAP